MTCALLEINRLLGKRWTIDILEDLSFHKKRQFNALKKVLGKVTSAVLSQRLRQLVNAHLVSRSVKDPKYYLTREGKELATFFTRMKRWGVKNNLVPVLCPEMNCNECLRKKKPAKHTPPQH